MGFSMSTQRKTGITRSTGSQPVRVYGSDADGGEDGLPVIVARGMVEMSYDGPRAPLTIEGFRTTETSWSPLAHEWVIQAERIPEES